MELFEQRHDLGVECFVQVQIARERIDIRLRESIRIVIHADHGVHFVAISAQQGEFAIMLQPFGSQASCGAFQHSTRFDGIPNVFDGERSHYKSAGGRGFEQALMRQTIESQTNGRSRHAQTRHQRELGDSFAGLKIAPQQHSPQVQQRTAGLGIFRSCWFWIYFRYFALPNPPGSI